MKNCRKNRAYDIKFLRIKLRYSFSKCCNLGFSINFKHFMNTDQ